MSFTWKCPVCPNTVDYGKSIWYKPACQHYYCDTCHTKDLQACAVCQKVGESHEFPLSSENKHYFILELFKKANGNQEDEDQNEGPSAKRARVKNGKSLLKCHSCDNTATEQQMYMCWTCHSEETDILKAATCSQCMIPQHIDEKHEHRRLFPHFRDKKYAEMSKNNDQEVEIFMNAMDELKKSEERKRESLMARFEESQTMKNVAKEAGSTAETDGYMTLRETFSQTTLQEVIKSTNENDVETLFHQNELCKMDKICQMAKQMQEK